MPIRCMLIRHRSSGLSILSNFFLSSLMVVPHVYLLRRLIIIANPEDVQDITANTSRTSFTCCPHNTQLYVKLYVLLLFRPYIQEGLVKLLVWNLLQNRQYVLVVSYIGSPIHLPTESTPAYNCRTLLLAVCRTQSCLTSILRPL